jgi:cell division septal protein FtsQ
MKLKPQPRATRRPAHPARGRGATRSGARPRRRGAQRPGVPLRQRFAGRLPSLRRLLAAVGAAAAVAGLVALVNGPWLSVRAVSWDGGVYTPASTVEAVLEQARGRGILAVDTRALRDELESLPSVSEASVTASLTGELRAAVVEPAAAVVWETSRGLLLASADGTVFGALPSDADLPDSLAGVPIVRDDRATAAGLAMGDIIPAAVLELALRVVAIDPAALGSETAGLSVRIDDEFGFRLVSDDAGWEVALGVYGTDPRESSAQAAARLERQVTAVRTLFATEREADIGWVDVRNPGKVYFRAKG